MSWTNEFLVYLSVTSFANSLAPSTEWYCRQDDFCSYTSPVMKAPSSTAVFTDYSQFRGNLGALAGLSEIELQDASGLYGAADCSAATGDDPDACKGILYYNGDGRNTNAVCPIGTEMVVTVSGTVGSIEYTLTPYPRVRLVGDMPTTCLFVNSGYRCESGEVTLRFTSTETPCDVAAGNDECPTPVVGRPYGTCASAVPCAAEELN